MTEEKDKYSQPGQEIPEPSFDMFLNGLASEVLIHLGKHPNPLTQQTVVNMPVAKYTIDLLRILKDKTEGNLSEREQELFRKLLEALDEEYEKAVQREG